MPKELAAGGHSDAELPRRKYLGYHILWPRHVFMTDQTVFSLAGKKVWVAGHRGMVGSAIVRRLERESCEILVADRTTVDLLRQDQVERWIKSNRPEVIVIAAAKVGGILANDKFPADFLYQNLVIEANIIGTAHTCGVKKLEFLGSSCIYPKLAPQPITEDALLTGPLEPTNEWYAVAKIAGIKLCQAYRRQHGADFISAMPTNLYGPLDNFDLQSSHVLPALIRKIHAAKLNNNPTVELWGTGSVYREFMHVDDLADACVFLLKHYSAEAHINVGTGVDLTVRELAHLIADVIGYRGEFRFDTTKPDGTPRKLMDGQKLAALGWKPHIDLRSGIASTYTWYLANHAATSQLYGSA